MKLNKRLIISLGIILGSVVTSIFAFVPINRIHDNYSKTWMSHVSDTTSIKELSLPGTHDSGATHSIVDVAGKCQDLDIKTQLNIGVRFLDLRIQLVNDEFVITHSFVKQNLTFKSVLNDISSFLKQNKSEFLLLSIKQEESSVNSQKDYETALEEILSAYKDVVSFDTSLPSTLKEARGKAYILSRSSTSFGIPAYGGWYDDTAFEMNDMYIQDNYCIDDINEKKNDILSTIEYTNNNADKLVLNFTSCYLDYGFPPTYAGTPAISINPWLLENIKDTKDKLGIMVIDFITEELTKSIYMRNIYE